MYDKMVDIFVTFVVFPIVVLLGISFVVVHIAGAFMVFGFAPIALFVIFVLFMMAASENQ
jgi:hypothetical protein